MNPSRVKSTTIEELYKEYTGEWWKDAWAAHSCDIVSLRKEIQLPDFAKIAPPTEVELISNLILVSEYLFQAEICYVFQAPLGAIALSASAIECFLKILLPVDVESNPKIPLGPLIDKAEEKGILTGNSLEQARNLYYSLRIPYVHSKTDEILPVSEVVKEGKTEKVPLDASFYRYLLEFEALRSLRVARIVLRDLSRYWQAHQ